MHSFFDTTSPDWQHHFAKHYLATSMDSITDVMFIDVRRTSEHGKIINRHMIRSHAAKVARYRTRMRSSKSKLIDANANNTSRIEQVEWYVIPRVFVFHMISGLANLAYEFSPNSNLTEQSVSQTVVEYTHFKESGTVRQQTLGHYILQQPAVHPLSQKEYRLLCHISKLYSPLSDSLSPKFILWTKGLML